MSPSKGGHGGEQDHLQLSGLPLLTTPYPGKCPPLSQHARLTAPYIEGILFANFYFFQVVSQLKPIVSAACHLMGKKDIDEGKDVCLFIILGDMFITSQS